MMYTHWPRLISSDATDARQSAVNARVTLAGPLIVHAASADAYMLAALSSAAVAIAGRTPPPLAAARIAVTT